MGIDWLGGLWVAEGCITTYRYANRPTQVLLKLTTTDEDIADRVCELLDSRKYSYKREGNKEEHQLVVGKRDEVKTILDSLVPYLQLRQRMKASKVADEANLNIIQNASNWANLKGDRFIAWLAGYVEGDGCLDIDSNLYPRLQINSIDEDILAFIQRSLNTGSICGPYADGLYKYTLTGKPCYDLMQDIYTYMGQRRASRILEISSKCRLPERQQVVYEKEFKKEVVEFALRSGVNKAAAFFKVPQTNVSRWKASNIV